MKINIDRDLLLVDLYDLLSLVTEASLMSEEAKKAKHKTNEIITMIANAPSAENNSSFPKISMRR